MRGWRKFAVAGLALLVGALSFATSHAANVKWTTVQVPWSNATGNSAAGAPKFAGIPTTGAAFDTLFITGPTDSNRTVIISTADWGFEELPRAGLGATSGAWNCATVTVTADVSNGAADSLYAILEPCQSGTCNRVLGTGAATDGMTAAQVAAALVADTKMSYGPGTAGGPPGIVFQGYLHADGIAALSVAAQNVWLRPSFRLNIIGDVSGTTPKLSGCRLFLTYPKRIIP